MKIPMKTDELFRNHAAFVARFLSRLGVSSDELDGHRTRASYDATQIPASAFGPRLMALIALITGVYHLSRRKTTDLLWELCGVRLSLGALSMIEARVSDALEPAVAEAWKRVGDGAVKHTDGTSW